MNEDLKNRIEKYKAISEECNKMADDLSRLNTRRGNSVAGTAGFDAEIINATRSNIERIKKGEKARDIVIDNNGSADTAVKYTNGQIGRGTQDKVGYTISALKRKVSEGKYDGQNFRINSDNDIFKPENSEKLAELKAIAKQYHIKIIKAPSTKKEVERFARVQKAEGNLNRISKAPVTSHMYAETQKVKEISKAIIEDVEGDIEKVNKFIDESTSKFISEEFAEINRAGLDAAKNAAIFAGTLSIVRNTVAVVKGDKEQDEAFRDVMLDTTASAATAYATKTLAEKLSVNLGGEGAMLVATGIVQVSKHMVSFINGDIEEEQLVSCVAETSAYIVASFIGRKAGEFVGGTVGAALGNMLLPGVGGGVGELLGAEIGKIIGEIITTAVCAEVISTIRLSKEFKKKNNKLISMYKNAEKEIRESQKRLELIINRDNQALRDAIKEGFEKIYAGIVGNSYESIHLGLVCIGERFGLKEDDFTKGYITRDNLFSQHDELLVVD
ncbi:MAG: hypothetical protein IJW18_06560 [Lachnospiraceae bacterium]|nr:hypothetical protein [Lachnospiraceae bacterium]